MKHLLDSTVLIDVTRNQGRVAVWLTSQLTSGATLYVSPITVTEFVSGVPVAKRESALAHMRTFPLLELDFEAAAFAGTYRYERARRGITISTPDALQASLAIRHGLILATSNPVHFDGVRQIDPREA